MRYRRWPERGGTYFFTLTLQDRTSRLLVDRIDALRAATAQVRRRHPFAIDACVVLPDHLHAIWTLPREDADFAMRWMLVKSAFSRALPAGEYRQPSRRRRSERGIWQRRFWEHQIRDESDFAKHVDYVHYNPVRHGYAEAAAAWPYSTVHRYIERGLLPSDWGQCVHRPDEIRAGERA